ncbi:uncharacterized protein LOC117653816 [Thrips palmi]|uniref:Uncharacterized protein LOC117653816 n=1 Tax=Thrips palmi TaxID=161013 RepID=A0A6P9ABX8_THRPL|nr:uncharacterized protein LOC117653816 [Thrips palmi]
MGHHEEWTFETSCPSSDESFGSGSAGELDQLKFEVAHGKWHLSLYRQALKDAEGGAEAAAVQLEMVKEHHRPNCAECDSHQMWVKLAAARKQTRDSSQQTSPILCQNDRKKRARIQRRSMST